MDITSALSLLLTFTGIFTLMYGIAAYELGLGIRTGCVITGFVAIIAPGALAFI